MAGAVLAQLLERRGQPVAEGLLLGTGTHAVLSLVLCTVASDLRYGLECPVMLALFLPTVGPDQVVAAADRLALVQAHVMQSAASPYDLRGVL